MKLFHEEHDNGIDFIIEIDSENSTVCINAEHPTHWIGFPFSSITLPYEKIEELYITMKKEQEANK